jgi:hypothetical protein
MSEEAHASPHDALFKRVFGDLENAAALLRCILPPQLADRVDWRALELRPGEYVDEQLAKHQSDLLFAAPISGTPVLFYVLVEHQSSPDPRMAWRLWRYVTRIWEQHEREGASKLPMVVPIVVYHGAKTWNAARTIAAMIEVPEGGTHGLEAGIPHFTYLLDDLTRLSPRELRARAMPAFGLLALFVLRAASDRPFAKTVGLFAELFDVVLWSDGPEALGTLFRYLSIVTREKGDDLVETVLASISELPRREGMNYHDALIEKGRSKGKAEVLLKQLTLKFGAPSPERRATIEGATTDELDQWAERILTAATLDEVFA